MINIIKEHKKIILKIFCIILFIIYSIKPISFDVKLYLGAAYQADLIGSFPINLINSWEHKLILNRLLFYLIFKIVNIFVNVNNIVIFEIMSKFIYGIITVVIIKIFSKQTKQFFSKYQISEETVFIILYIILIGAGTYFSMQTEASALLILLLAIIFALKPKVKYQIITSFLISTLFFLKGVTLLYSIIILIIMLLNKKPKNHIIITISMSFIFLLLELFILYKIDKAAIIDIYLSTQYITKSWESYSILQYILYNIINSIYFGIGLIALIYNIICHTKTKNYKLLILEIMAWTILFLGIYIQKMKYLYQIALIFPACIFSLLIAIYYNKQKIINLNIYIKMVIYTYIITIFITTIAHELDLGIQINQVTQKNEKIVEQINNKNKDLQENEVLYIGNGLSAYYIKAKSYTKYTTTIYLANDNSIYLNSKYVQELKEKIKNYTGKYIIIDNEEWQKKRRLSDDIIEYIKENYHYKQSTQIMTYEAEKEEYSSIYERNS